MTPQADAHCEGIISQFSAEFRAKYRKGQAEHGGDMLEKPGMLEHAIEEVIDLAAYLYTQRMQDSRRPKGLMPVVYVAGPFRGKDSWEMEANIRRAETLSLEVWRLGCAAICPHSNTRFFQGAAPDAVWLDGDLAMLAKCDGMLMTPDWQKSQGATAEHDFAQKYHIPVFYTLDALRAWKDDRPKP
jgi:hypothetical protein